MNANIKSDEEILSWLDEYIKSGVVTVKHRNCGGLDIDVASKSFHKHPNDYSSIKGYLRRNGFTSFVGIHSRKAVGENVRGENFKPEYQLPEDIFNGVVKKVSEENPDIPIEDIALSALNCQKNFKK